MKLTKNKHPQIFQVKALPFHNPVYAKVRQAEEKEKGPKGAQHDGNRKQHAV